MKIKKEQGEEEQRKAHILNTILVGVIVLVFIAFVINIVVSRSDQDAISEIVPGALLLFLSGLYAISKFISSKFTSFTLIGLLSFLAYYMAYQWGAVIPHSWIVLALTVVMGGILINSVFCLFLILAHSIVLGSLTYLQILEKISYQNWDITPTIGSVLVTVIILSIIAVISWLSNREIEKALRRVRQSEKALQKERDSLEIKVEKRTKELKEIQLEKISHLYHLADFGRMTAGLFHDIANPLTTVSLNLEKLSRDNKSLVVERAVQGTKRMESFVQAVKKQIQKQETKSIFSPDEEITQAIEVLSYRAKNVGVSINKTGNQKIKTYGNPLRFNQLVTNLLGNAIDAYKTVGRQKNRKISIELSMKNKEIILIVQDFGCGIAKKNIKKVFSPFFTTKSIEKGTGIGLAISEDIVEKEFGGKIKVESKENEGTTFTVRIPVNKKIK